MNKANPFTTTAILKQSWQRVAGAKWPILAPLIVILAITIGVNLLASLLFGLMGIPFMHSSFTIGYSAIYVITAFIIEVIILFLTAPLIAGAQMVALKQIRNEKINHSLGFKYWPQWFYLGLTVLIISLGAALIDILFGALITLSSQVGTWLVILCQILALIAFILFYSFYIFSILFIADKKQNPIEALCASVNMVWPHWRLVFRVMAWIAVALIIVLIPFFILSMTGWALLSYIGLMISIVLSVWAMPYFHLIVGSVFNELAP